MADATITVTEGKAVVVLNGDIGGEYLREAIITQRETQEAIEAAIAAGGDAAVAGALAGQEAGATAGAEAALSNVGTTAGTLAAGDDSRIVGAAQKSSNLSDLADAEAAVENLGLASRVYLSPLSYGAAGDGTTNDTTAWLAVIAAAKATGLPIDGGNKLYGVNFGIFGGAGLGVNFSLRNARFKDLNPNQTTGTSRTLRFDGAGKNTSDWIRLENVSVDRNGGSVDTVLHGNVGLEISGVSRASVSGIKVFGNNAGELVRIEDVALIDGDMDVGPGFYVHTSQTNDTIEGVVLTQVDSAFLRLKIGPLGRTDRTTVERSRYSRGLTLDRCRNGHISVDIREVDQGIDYSGHGSSRVKVTGNVRHCFNNGVKLAHAHYIDNITGVNVTHIGRYGVIIGGPGGSEGQPYQREIRISGFAISEIGSNGYYKGIGNVTMGVGLDRNSSDPFLASFPKNVVIEGNVITSYTGSVVVTRDGGDLVMANGSFPVSTGKPVTFTSTGTLPTGLFSGSSANLNTTNGSEAAVLASGTLRAGQVVVGSGLPPGTMVQSVVGSAVTLTAKATATASGVSVAATDTYWLGWDETSFKVRVATSYINALDGVFLTLSGGSGTHTMTGKSFMDYGGFADAESVKDRAAPNYFRNNTVIGATVADSAGFSGTFAYVVTSGSQSLADDTWTDIILNGSSPGGDLLGKIDPDGLYNTSTGVFTLTQGVWSVNGVVAFAANSTGRRESRLVLDSGSGYKQLWSTRRFFPQEGTEPTDVLVSEVVRVGAAGALLKVQGRQAITGGGALNTHSNSRLSVSRIG